MTKCKYTYLQPCIIKGAALLFGHFNLCCNLQWDHDYQSGYLDGSISGKITSIVPVGQY